MTTEETEGAKTVPTSAPLASDSRYNPVFIPGWLIAVNSDQNGNQASVSKDEAHRIDFPLLSAALYPAPILERLEGERLKNSAAIAATWPSGSRATNFKSKALPHAIAIVDRTRRSESPSASARLEGFPSQLNAQTYAQHWAPLLRIEYEARLQELQQSSLYCTQLVPFENGKAIWSFEAKHLREGYPPVDIGDSLLLRQLRPHIKFWQGITFVATVWGLNRAKGEVFVRCDTLQYYVESLLFNITFLPQDRKFFAMADGMEALQLGLHRPRLSPGISVDATRDQSRTSAELLLFPIPSDLDRSSIVDDARATEEIETANERMEEAIENFCWVNESLNDEQRSAVLSIVLGNTSSIPFVVTGPPGTGKTSVLVEAILQVLRNHPQAHVLVCGASNPSADTLAARLRAHLSPKEMLRLNDPSRPFAEVRSELLPWCFTEEERFSLPSLTVLLDKRVIVTSCIDASLLLTVHCTNRALATLESSILSTLHPHAPLPRPLIDPHFSFLMIDEAAQAQELETALPLACIVTDVCTRAAHVTVVGDASQLGPIIISSLCRDEYEMNFSWLERLCAREVYRDHPASRHNQRFKGKSAKGEWKMGTPFVDLVRNYRSHPAILMMPSTLFYHETLLACAKKEIQESPLRSYFRLPTRNFPVLMLGVEDGIDEPQDEGASFYNEAEVDLVVQLCRELVNKKQEYPSIGIVKPKQISVISPFREQVWRVRLRLRAEGLSDVDVGNVEALQGMENRIVIISTVRARERWLKGDFERGRGLIHEPKRLNVALTRAQELLIVVGNASLLVASDPNWRAFYEFVDRNGSYVGSAVHSDGEPARVSKAELNFRATLDKPLSNGDATKHETREFDVLVGSVAQSTLVDDD